MLSLDESGRLVVWLPNLVTGELASLLGPCEVLAIPPRPKCVAFIDSRLWTFYSTSESLRAARTTTPFLQVFDPFSKSSYASPRHHFDDHSIGNMTCGAVVPSKPSFVFLGDE